MFTPNIRVTIKYYVAFYVSLAVNQSGKIPLTAKLSLALAVKF